MIKELNDNQLYAVSGAGSFGPLIGSFTDIVGSITHPPSDNLLNNIGNTLQKTGDALSGLYGNIGQAAPGPLQSLVPWAILGAGTATGAGAGAGAGALAGGLAGATLGAIIGGAALSPI